MRITVVPRPRSARGPGKRREDAGKDGLPRSCGDCRRRTVGRPAAVRPKPRGLAGAAQRGVPNLGNLPYFAGKRSQVRAAKKGGAVSAPYRVIGALHVYPVAHLNDAPLLGQGQSGADFISLTAYPTPGHPPSCAKPATSASGRPRCERGARPRWSASRSTRPLD